MRRWPVAKLSLVAIWLVAVLALASRHAMWRDEVRALSLALRGDDVVGMFDGLRGEGHPAIWYLLLRAAHGIAPTTLVLPIVAAVVGIGAVLLLVSASPFRWPFLAVVLFGQVCLYEYTVKARNYGISMLILFAAVIVYSRLGAGFLTGALLFILANCNVHSGILVLAFLGFVALEHLRQHGLRPGRPLLDFVVCALLAAAGLAVCAVTVYPPVNDAAAAQTSFGLSTVVTALALPGTAFAGLFPLIGHNGPTPAINSLILFGSTLALIRVPAAALAALAALLMLSVFFQVIYPGGYRHQALWLVFLVAMYWMSLQDGHRAVTPPSRVSALAEPAGVVLLAILFALQLFPSADGVADALRGVPESRSRDLAHLVAAHPELQQSWILADPDYLVEPLPYYLSNPTYLLREHRAGSVVTFTAKAQLHLTLDDVLATARRLRTESGHPVLILLSKPPAAGTAEAIAEGYDWTFTAPVAQVTQFLAATRHLAGFAPARTDETFDVYVLD